MARSQLPYLGKTFRRVFSCKASIQVASHKAFSGATHRSAKVCGDACMDGRWQISPTVSRHRELIRHLHRTSRSISNASVKPLFANLLTQFLLPEDAASKHSA